MDREVEVAVALATLQWVARAAIMAAEAEAEAPVLPAEAEAEAAHRASS